jgi:hypothetical protein
MELREIEDPPSVLWWIGLEIALAGQQQQTKHLKWCISSQLLLVCLFECDFLADLL